MTIRVVLADDHLAVIKGLESAFRNTEIEIVGVAETSAEALQKTSELTPDVLVIDVVLPERDGLHVLEQVPEVAPNTRVVMLSMHDNPTYVARAVALGAKDYLLKTTSLTMLVKAIRRVAGDADPVGSELVEQVKQTLREKPARRDRSIPLTVRELQVLKHVAFGLSNREIGMSLSISVETVKEHVQNILRKVDVSDRTQAAVWAVRNKVV